VFLRRTPLQMWEQDLEVFVKEWESIRENWIQESSSSGKKQKPTTLRTRKSIGKGKKKAQSDDESEDDFKPSKPVTKKPATTARVVSGTAPKAAKRVAEKHEPAPNQSDADADNDAYKPQAAASGSGQRSTIRQRAAARVVSQPKNLQRDEEGGSASNGKAQQVQDLDSDVEMIEPLGNKTKGKETVKRKTSDNATDEDLSKPAKKAKITSAQTSVNDFFKPKSPMSKAAAMKGRVQKPSATQKLKKALDEDGDSFMEEDAPVSSRREVAKRPARGAAKTYIEIGSDEELVADDSF